MNINKNQYNTLIYILNEYKCLYCTNGDYIGYKRLSTQCTFCNQTGIHRNAIDDLIKLLLIDEKYSYLRKNNIE